MSVATNQYATASPIQGASEVHHSHSLHQSPVEDDDDVLVATHKFQEPPSHLLLGGSYKEGTGQGDLGGAIGPQRVVDVIPVDANASPPQQQHNVQHGGMQHLRHQSPPNGFQPRFAPSTSGVYPMSASMAGLNASTAATMALSGASQLNAAAGSPMYQYPYHASSGMPNHTPHYVNNVPTTNFNNLVGSASLNASAMSPPDNHMAIANPNHTMSTLYGNHQHNQPPPPQQQAHFPHNQRNGAPPQYASGLPLQVPPVSFAIHATGTPSNNPMIRTTQQQQQQQHDQLQHSKEASPTTPDMTEEGGQNLFVANLSNDVDDDLFYRTFSPYGEILSAKVMLDIHTGRSRGFGFVMYTDASCGLAASRALHNSVLGERGQRISVTKAQTSGKSAIAETTKLYVRNVPKTVPEIVLKEYFAEYGAIKRLTRKEDTAAKNDATKHAIAKQQQVIPPTMVIFLEYNTPQEAQNAVRNIHGKKPWPGMAIPLLAKTAETTENRNVRKERQRQKAVEAPRAQGPAVVQATSLALGTVMDTADIHRGTLGHMAHTNGAGPQPPLYQASQAPYVVPPLASPSPQTAAHYLQGVSLSRTHYSPSTSMMMAMSASQEGGAYRQGSGGAYRAASDVNNNNHTMAVTYLTHNTGPSTHVYGHSQQLGGTPMPMAYPPQHQPVMMLGNGEGIVPFAHSGSPQRYGTAVSQPGSHVMTVSPPHMGVVSLGSHSASMSQSQERGQLISALQGGPVAHLPPYSYPPVSYAHQSQPLQPSQQAHRGQPFGTHHNLSPSVHTNVRNGPLGDFDAQLLIPKGSMPYGM